MKSIFKTYFRKLKQGNLEDVVVGEGCTDDYPHLYEDVYTEYDRCCDTVPGENEYGVVVCLGNDIDKS